MDYSKLTDEQLEAIARGDYSKLPDNVLRQIINENQVAPGATARPADPPGFNRQAARDAGYTDEEIDGHLRNPPTEAGTIGQETQGLAQALAVPVATALNYAIENPIATAGGAYGAYKGRQLINAAINRLNPTAPVAPTTAQGSPVTETTGPARPSGTARQINIVDANTPQRSVILNAQGEPITRAPAQAMGAVAPEAQAATQAARTAAPAAAQSGNIMSRVAPYLQAAGKVAAPVARVAGPAGAAITAYETYPYLQQAEVGPRAASGEVGKMVRGANRMALNMPTPAPLSAQEARNLLASGDERTINIYGGRARLQAIANPNALNSGYAQELNRLGR